MKKSLLKKYAKLLVRQGVNIQKKQPLVIVADVEAVEFVELLAEAAYKAGASDVRVDWWDVNISKLGYRYKDLKNLRKVAEWEKVKASEDVSNVPARIRVICEDPDAYAGLDSDRISQSETSRGKILKTYRDALEGKQQWLVCAVPGKAWAKKVFPNCRPSVAVEKLWEAILKTVGVDEKSDPLKVWEEKNASFQAKCDWLNDQCFDYLHYASKNGTDFTCDLMPEALWCGGGERTISGVYFNPNMPTEEIFTTPIQGRCSGKLVSTMPLSVRGTLIENFEINFRNGEAVSWKAEKGEEALGKLIMTDEGSGKIGELALVPKNSPIAESGLLFYNTLFDENASCHVALGMGYSSCIMGYNMLKPKDFRRLGVNDSVIHVDFMIGADDLCITGYKDGVATPIFVNGTWADEIKNI